MEKPSRAQKALNRAIDAAGGLTALTRALDAALDDEAFEARKAAASRAAVASVERTREERNADKKARRGEREADLGARVAAQDGVCAICKTVGRGKNSTRLHIDHDHNTGKVRALLCFQCNVGLGKFKDNSELLLAAAHYIERFTCASS